MKKTFNASLAIGIAAVMGFTPAVPVFAAENTDTGVTKDETVYVNADANGDTDKITVTDHLINAGSEKELKDSSDLKDIENVKGDETYSGSGDNMTWKTNGADIFYQGTSDKELPVGVKITYYLDDKEIAPKDLAGKSGKLKIKIAYTNNTGVQAKVGDEDTTLQTPFAMMTGLILPSDKFSNVTVDNGKIVDDGSRSIVLGFGFPGLKETLNLDQVKDDAAKDLDDSKNSSLKTKIDDFQIPDSVEITADVKDFELENTYTVALTDVFDDIDLGDIENADDLNDAIDELEDATVQLVDGSKELADGAKTLNDSYGQLDDGIAALKDGVDQAANGINQYADGVSQVNTGAKALQSGLAQLQSQVNGSASQAGGLNLSSLNSGIAQLQSGSKSLSDGMPTLNAGVQQLINQTGTTTSSMIQQLQALDEGLGTAIDGLKALTDVETNKDTVSKYVGEVRTSAQKLKDGMQALETQQADLTAKLQQATAGQAQAQAAVEQAQAAVQSITTAEAAAEAASQTAANTAASGTADAATLQTAQANLQQAQATVQSTQAAVQTAQASLQQAQAAKAEADATVNTLNEYAQQAQAGMQQYQQAAQSAEALSALISDDSAVDAIVQYNGENVVDFKGKVQQIIDGLQGARTSIETAIANAQSQTQSSAAQLQALQQGMQQATDGAAQLYNGISALGSGLNQTGITQKLSALSSGVQQLYDGANALAAGTQQLDANTPSLKAGAKQLSDGVLQLSTGSKQVKDGIAQLSTGADSLSSGMSEYKTSGIDKLTDTLNEVMGKFSDAKDRLSALNTGDTSYTNYSGLADGMKGQVQFVISTDAIETEADN